MPKANQPFKEGLDAAAVRRLARNVAAVHAAFPRQRFVRSATRGLSDLELKARVFHIVGALRLHLPQNPKTAIAVLLRAGKGWNAEETTGPTSGFAAWPLIDFVGEHGLESFDSSLKALRKLTQLFSAEFAIRPFLERDPERALRALHTWTADRDPHVRRLVSEGTRPRLPWGRRLRRFQEDPTETLALLEALKDDDSEYVRRSVANHLNDVSKDHPERAVAVCARWAKGASPERLWIVRHALRSLIKAGDSGALKVLGFDPKAKVEVRGLTLSKKGLRLGQDLGFEFELRSRSTKAQRLVVDYAVHHVKANGSLRPKVFKLKTLELGPRATTFVGKTHKLRKISTRRYYSGRHAIEILVNGAPRAKAEFDLRV